MANDAVETILSHHDYPLFNWNSLMPGVTLKILHGADRGKVFEDLSPPFTVGREEGNDIQLNDERVSRCHF
jgi:pSer/pThr/pTyr-binding forkhead associated (FHA) protein